MDELVFTKLRNDAVLIDIILVLSTKVKFVIVIIELLSQKSNIFIKYSSIIFFSRAESVIVKFIIWENVKALQTSEFSINKLAKDTVETFVVAKICVVFMFKLIKFQFLASKKSPFEILKRQLCAEPITKLFEIFNKLICLKLSALIIWNISASFVWVKMKSMS